MNGTTTPAKAMSPWQSSKIYYYDEVISSVCIFSSNLRFTTSAHVTISVFAYKSKWDIPDTTIIYPYRFKDDAGYDIGKQYSGYGDGYFLTASEITVKLSDIVNNNGVYFATNNQDNRMFTVNNGNTPDEIIHIHIAVTNYEVNVRNSHSKWRYKYHTAFAPMKQN